MSKVRFLLSKIGRKRLLYIRVIYISLALMALAASGSYFAHRAVSTNPSQYSDGRPENSGSTADTGGDTADNTETYLRGAYTGFGSAGLMLIHLAAGALLSAGIIYILVKVEAEKDRSHTESIQKSVFLANMSHEIRTPMNAIIGMTTIGKSAPGVERKDYCFSKIEDASLHLLGVINNILDMSKIEANKFELSSEVFNLEKMLQKAVNVINFRVGEKQQDFTVYIDKNIPGALVGDDQRLAQVVTNLLSNAVKFTPDKGAIRLDAYLLEQDPKSCTVQIAVTDEGIGLSREQQATLFHSFQQAESNTARKYGGTGLGLAISKNIVEMMGGSIWIESEPGKGSRFIFRIKMKRGEEQERVAPIRIQNLNGTSILVVDDNPELLEYLRELIREFGMVCDTAADAPEALKLYEKKGPYNICFVDWSLPGMDGIELSKALKKITPMSGKTIIILISSIDWTSIEADARKAGVDYFLTKPIFPSDVTDIVNEALGVKRLTVIEEEPGIEGAFEGWRILLAEDVEINREIVLALLEPTLLDIDFAENGAEAVRMFSDHPERYDMIFMDVQMPIMDGYEATRRIRSLNLPGAADIPIIALTANVFREDVEKCLEAGMSGHIGKPLDYNDIVEKLQMYLPDNRIKRRSAAG